MADSSLAPTLRIAVARLARRLRQGASDGLTPSLASALATLSNQGPLSAGELARAEQVTPPSITALVNRLDEHGLIERVSDPADRRVVRIGLSAEGAARIEAIRRRKDEQLEALLAALSDTEREQLALAAPILERLAALALEPAPASP